MRVPWQLAIPAVLLEAGYWAILQLGPNQHRIADVVAILLGSQAVYLIAAGLVWNNPQSFKSFQMNHLFWWVLGSALLFRVTVFPLEARFTDDPYRYRWEARLQAAGGNPYLAAPNDAAWSHLRDETFDRIPGRDFRAVYGPFTEWVYRAAYTIVARITSNSRLQLFWMKLPAAGFELLLIFAVVALLEAAGVSRERVLIYAWNPLPVFEFWGNGHNDPLMLAPLAFALAAATRERWTRAFAWLGLAAAAKIWPLALLPLFSGFRRIRYAAITLGVFFVLMLPYRAGLASNARFLSGFMGGWRNNDSVYGILLLVTGDVYLAKYAAFGLLAAALAFLSVSRLGVILRSRTAIAAMLLVSANCHPWYLSWLLPIMPVAPSAGLLLWCALMPVTYAVLPAWWFAGEWNGSSPIRWMVYIPVFTVLTWEAARTESFKNLLKRVTESGARPHVPK